MLIFKANILSLSLALVTIASYAQSDPTDSRKWYKGNLHTHFYWSDGDEFPEVIMDWYKSNGYHFVALTDHNIKEVRAGEASFEVTPDLLFVRAKITSSRRQKNPVEDMEYEMAWVQPVRPE